MNKTFKDESEWLAFRKTRITASEVAVALGKSSFRTRADLYIAKTTELADTDKEYIRWGRRLEPVVADELIYQRGGELIKLPPYTCYWPDNEDPVSATPDFFYEAPGRDDVGVLEIKTAGVHNMGQWTGEPPLEYILQLQTTMHCTGLKWGIIACLLAGQRLVWKDYDYDAELMALALPQIRITHDAILRRNADSLLAETVLDSEAWARLFPQDSGGFQRFTEFTPEQQVTLSDAYARLAAHKATVAGCETEIEKAEHDIKAIMKDLSSIQMPDGSRFDWRVQHRKETVISAKTLRVFRHYKAKKEKER
jgi:putative phage-type endonuclease